LTPNEATTTQPVTPIPEQAPAHNQIPEPVQNYIDKNVVMMNGLDCSGAIIRNTQDKAVGVLTGAHCGLRSDQSGTVEGSNESTTPWILGGDGKRYVLKNGGVKAEVGYDAKNLVDVGHVTQFVVPPAGNVDMDQALGVLPGHTAQEVIDSYEKMQLSRKEIDTLIPGQSTIWMGAWPGAQNGDGEGNEVRQDFATTYIGQMTVTNTIGETIHIVLSAAYEDQDGALCSPGASGSEGLVLPQGDSSTAASKLRSVGSLSAAWQFTDAANPSAASQTVAYFQAKYPDFDWQGVGAVCGFATKAPTKEHAIVRVADSIDKIPDPQVTDQITAATLFYDLDYKPTIIDGTVVAQSQNRPEGGNGKTAPVIIDKPVIFINKNGSVVVGYCNNGDLSIESYPDSDNIRFYPDAPGISLSTVKTRSMINNDPTTTNGIPNLGSFQSADGLQFGIYDTAAPPNVSGQAYKVVVKNGRITFAPAS
jgi:hypothetical protein